MGMGTYLFGFIREAWAKPEGMARIVDHNESVLTALPDDDVWPPLTRTMFGWPSSDAPKITYDARMFHFAASLKQIDDDLDLWIPKFENLLRSLYWSEAIVMVQGYIIPICDLRWVPTLPWLSEPATEPPREWRFETTMDPELWSGVTSGRLGGRNES